MKNPPEGPVTEMADGWMTSAWSDGDMTYLLAVHDTDVDALRGVLPGRIPEA